MKKNIKVLHVIVSLGNGGAERQLIEILENNTVVKITHTLTSAFCPMADEINQNIQKAGMVEGVKESIANCTFQPPFNMDMVPEETKMAMGWN